MFIDIYYNFIMFSGVCDDCAMANGVGYNPHPEDCDKFIQCFFGEKGELRAIDRQCGYGQYWDQTVLTCRKAAEVPCRMGK